MRWTHESEPRDCDIKFAFLRFGFVLAYSCQRTCGNSVKMCGVGDLRHDARKR